MAFRGSYVAVADAVFSQDLIDLPAGIGCFQDQSLICA